jgi:predicted metal-dependent peptidase
MDNNDVNTATDLVKQALKNVLVVMPHLVGLVQHIRPMPDERVETAAITASGKLIYNVEWILSLSLQNITFIMAHELMHLVLRSHERQEGADPELFNVAHDIIINALLEKAFDCETPANGLRWQQFFKRLEWESHKSQPVEKVIVSLKKQMETKPHLKNLLSGWGDDVVEEEDNSPLGAQLKKLLGNQMPPSVKRRKTDVLTRKQEKALFPNESSQKIALSERELEKRIFEAMSTEQMQERFKKVLEGQKEHFVGDEAGEQAYTYEILKRHYAPPWQWAMQQWLESTAQSVRSYARPSRRGTPFREIGMQAQYNSVLAGKKREGFTLHLVLDTSGSMWEVMPKILGVIASFCESMNIETVHVLQCDVGVTSDDWVEPSELSHYQIKGFGGSDMSAALLQLADDAEVERIIVITDGYIDYPNEPMPYDVLWVLTADSDNYCEGFEPIYGQVIRIDN